MTTRNVLVKALLVDSEGTPLPNKPVSLYYRQSGSTTWLDIGTNPHTTGSDGYASDTISVTVPANYDFRAEFAGDEDYEASYAELLNQRIKAKIVLTLSITPQ